MGVTRNVRTFSTPLLHLYCQQVFRLFLGKENCSLNLPRLPIAEPFLHGSAQNAANSNVGSWYYMARLRKVSLASSSSENPPPGFRGAIRFPNCDKCLKGTGDKLTMLGTMLDTRKRKHYSGRAFPVNHHCFMSGGPWIHAMGKWRKDTMGRKTRTKSRAATWSCLWVVGENNI